jgi:hypothetical protein
MKKSECESVVLNAWGFVQARANPYQVRKGQVLKGSGLKLSELIGETQGQWEVVNCRLTLCGD